MVAIKEKPVMIECYELADDESMRYVGKREATDEEIEAYRRSDEEYAKVWPYNERAKRANTKKGLRAFLASLFA